MNMFTNEEKSYIEGMDLSRLPEHAPHVVIALGQHNKGNPVTTRCPYCNSPITIELKGNPPTAWVHGCSCGKCNGSFRGL
ncbi:hypothetical protein KCM76_12470 [Zooshikella marina]|uniref:hypothetical protein n=1 Tax=Zooshikella ganghwensis TaxID=202772 RepID=UPI001BAEDA37|nr:hypothetical protein [Zooshikella ganghwensis]MBU2706799.1 hypothetical protein [Zooshikella ganghwensis]